MQNEQGPNDFMRMLGLDNLRKLTPKEQAIQNDQRLQSCAAYEVSHGLMLPITDPDKLMKTFAQFKMLVRRGSMTVEEIENMMAKKWGAVKKEKDEIELLMDEDPYEGDDTEYYSNEIEEAEGDLPTE